MSSFLRRLWKRRWFRGLMWTGITLVTLYVLLVAWVNWAGARRWEVARQTLEQEKLTLDFRDTMPPVVKPEENFCAIPLLEGLAVVIDGDPEKGPPAANRERFASVGIPAQPTDKPKTKRPMLGSSAGAFVPTDLKAWATSLRELGVLQGEVESGANPAREVMQGLAFQEDVIRELATGLDRPRAQLQPSMKALPLPRMLFAVPLPHLGSMHSVSQGLLLRTVAAAQAGDAAKAHEAARISTRLAEAMFDEPFLIGLLVGCNAGSASAQAVWELCATHAGTAEDFKKLQQDLEKIDVRAASLRSWKCELAAGVDAIRMVGRSRDASVFTLVQAIGDGKADNPWFMYVVPTGWFDMNAASLVKWETEYLIKPLRDEGWMAQIRQQPLVEEQLMRSKSAYLTHLDEVLTLLILPATHKISIRAAHTSHLISQAVIACALERHRLEHGAYPDSLEALKREGEKPLPPDPLSGNPMGYRKTGDGSSYILWGVGPDGKDDGGKRDPRETQREKPVKPHDADYAGDWVWDFASMGAGEATK